MLRGFSMRTLLTTTFAVLLLASSQVDAQRYRGNARVRSTSSSSTSMRTSRTAAEGTPLRRGSLNRGATDGAETTRRATTGETRVRNAPAAVMAPRQARQANAAAEAPRTRLTPTGGGNYRTPSGLGLTKRSIRSVLSHGRNRNGDRPHGVFSAGRRGAIGVVDSAWQRVQSGGQGVTTRQGRDGATVHTVDMGRAIGFVGGSVRGRPEARFVTLVVRDRQLVTAYPSSGSRNGRRGNNRGRQNNRQSEGSSESTGSARPTRPADTGSVEGSVTGAATGSAPRTPRYARPGSDPRNPTATRGRGWTRVNNPRRNHPSRARNMNTFASRLSKRAEVPMAVARRAAQEVALGLPTNAGRSNPNNYLIARNDMVISYNRERRIPNWVGWRTTRNDVAVSDDVKVRANDFRTDPTLPRNWDNPQVSDYRHSGYDRGHVVSSGERQQNMRQNSRTYVFTNIMPQAPGNNRGPWRHMEYHIREMAQAGNDVHVFAGPGFERGATPRTIGENRVAVPDFTWKIAVITPPGQRLGDINANTRVIAIKIPNTNNVDGNASGYRTSVAEIEAATGLQFFTNLPRDVANALRNRVDSGELGAPPPPPGS